MQHTKNYQHFGYFILLFFFFRQYEHSTSVWVTFIKCIILFQLFLDLAFLFAPSKQDTTKKNAQTKLPFFLNSFFIIFP